MRAGTYLSILVWNRYDRYLLWVVLHLLHNVSYHINEYLTLFLGQNILINLRGSRRRLSHTTTF
jgi:hypothetical protein